MQWKRASAAILLVVLTLAIAQSGCQPFGELAVPPEATSAPSEGNAVTPAPEATESSTSEVGATPAPAAAEPAAAPAVSPGPAKSPSPAPSPAKVAAAKSPTAVQTTTDVIAVTMAKDNRIAVVDPITAKVSHLIDFNSPAGRMALAPDGHSAWVFAPQPGSAAVAMVDVLTGDRQDLHFGQGDGPSDVAFSTDGSREYVAMAGSGAAASGASTIAFAGSNGHEFGRVTLGRQSQDVQIRRQLSSLAVSPGANGDVLYAAGAGSGVVWALDTGSGAVLKEIEVGGAPTSIVTDPLHQRAYVLVDTLNQVVSIDTSTLTVGSRLQLPAHPVAAAIGPDGTVFADGGDSSGELWVIAPGVAEMRARVPLGGLPAGLAVSSDGKSLYVPDATNSALAILSSDTIQLTRNVTLPAPPFSVLAVYPSAVHQQLAAAAADDGATAQASTPQIMPTPAPLPQGARPPDDLPQGAVAEPFVSGAANPVAIAFAPDGRLFYNELRTGKIRVVQNGTLLPDPFYQFLVTDQPDAGLLGLTLDPDFQNNHYVYVFYTAPNATDGAGGAHGPNEVVRLTDVDNKGTDLRPVMQGLPSGPVHNSGTLRFGPDGKLYITLADDEKGTNAQDLSSLMGKILRINPDGSIPDDNPFAGQSGKQAAIWAYGLHNAYSFAFHPVGHTMLAVDDGVKTNDQLNLIVRGANYGWPGSGYQSKSGVNDPIAVINPPVVPTGSTFYTGDLMPDWKNDWFFCDANQSELRRVRLASGSFDRVVFEEVVKQGCSLDVATGPDGALYYSDAQGIYRIRMSSADALPAVKDAGLPLQAPMPTPEPTPPGGKPPKP